MGRPPIGNVAMTGAERVRRYRLKHGNAKPVTKVTKPSSDNTALAKELAQAKARIAELEAGQGQAKAGADAAHWEAEIAALRDENYTLRVELEAQNNVIKTRNGGGLSNAEYRILQQCCHPDNSASKETRERGFRLINQLRYVLCNEAELPSMDERKYSTWARQMWP